MTKPVVLVTSATSRNGAYAARQLLATQKYTIRLGARDPTKLRALVEQGAEAVKLDSTLESIRRAFSGVDSVYMVIPDGVDVGEDIIFNNYLQVVLDNNNNKESGSGITHIVYLSAMDISSPDDDFEAVHKHYDNEQKLIRSGIPFTILRPTWFHENTLSYHANSIKRTGEFRTSCGAGVWTSVAIIDIAAVAAAALMDPVKHAGKIYTLMEEALTDDELAEKIGKAAGKKVTHVNLTPEEHAKFLKESYVGTPLAAQADEVTEHRLKLDKEKRDSRFSVVRPDLELVLGRKGVSLDDFFAEHADVFREH